MVEIGDRAIEVAHADIQESAIRVIIWSAAPKADRVVEIRERLRQLLAALSQPAARRVHICVLRIAFDGAFEYRLGLVQSAFLRQCSAAPHEGEIGLRIKPFRLLEIGECFIGPAAKIIPLPADHASPGQIRVRARSLLDHRRTAGQHPILDIRGTVLPFLSTRRHGKCAQQQQRGEFHGDVTES
jgi:hypothetical protein